MSQLQEIVEEDFPDGFWETVPVLYELRFTSSKGEVKYGRPRDLSPHIAYGYRPMLLHNWSAAWAQHGTMFGCDDCFYLAADIAEEEAESFLWLLGDSKYKDELVSMVVMLYNNKVNLVCIGYRV